MSQIVAGATSVEMAAEARPAARTRCSPFRGRTIQSGTTRP